MTVSKRNQAYDFLREKIIFCEYKPGDVIDEKEIAVSLGMSRTPVREAIAHLAEEKLVKIFPRKGIVVNQVSLKDLLDMIDVRLLVEPYAIGHSFDYLDQRTLLEFRQSERTNLQHYETSDEILNNDFDYRFHLYFTQVIGNGYIENLMKNMLALSQRTRVFLPFTKERMIQSCNEHLEIIEFILNGDIQSAQQAVTRHLLQSKEGYLRAFQTHTEYFVQNDSEEGVRKAD